MFLIELNPLQISYLADLMDKAQGISGTQAMHHAVIRQQISNPQLTDSVAERFRNEGRNQALPQ